VRIPADCALILYNLTAPTKNSKSRISPGLVAPGFEEKWGVFTVQIKQNFRLL
jgi:hypothetical protein